MDTTQLARIADEAYGAACAAPDDYSRGYAAGVEDLARKLAGGNPADAGRLAELLGAASFKAGAPS